MPTKKLQINVPATVVDVFPNQWLFHIEERTEQETEDGKPVFIAQATGKRMTRLETGQFVALDGSQITEADLADGFLTPTVKVRQLNLAVGFPDSDERGQADLKEALTPTQFNNVVKMLKTVSEAMLTKKQEVTEDSVLVDDDANALDKL